jgi:hypothetical protein
MNECPFIEDRVVSCKRKPFFYKGGKVFDYN